MSDVKYQVKEGLKSIARVGIATAVGGPAAGAAMMAIETVRSTAIAAAGKEGTAGLNVVSAAMDGSSFDYDPPSKD